MALLFRLYWLLCNNGGRHNALSMVLKKVLEYEHTFGLVNTVGHAVPVLTHSYDNSNNIERGKNLKKCILRIFSFIIFIFFVSETSVVPLRTHLFSK